MEYPREDYQTKIAKSAATFLARWNGGQACLYELTVSHRSLTVRLARSETERQAWYFNIACVDPSWIQGPSVWNDCKISILAHQKLRTGEDGFRLVDPQAGVEIETTTIELAECQYKKNGRGR